MKIILHKELFQWEKDRSIFIELSENEKERPLYIQFYNHKTQCAPLFSLNSNQVLIPNILLQEPYPITALICTETEVLARKEFKVLKRPKPLDYSDDSKDLLELNKLIGGDT